FPLSSRAAHSFFFFLTHPAPPELYPLSLHDALPICGEPARRREHEAQEPGEPPACGAGRLQPSAQAHLGHGRRLLEHHGEGGERSEEHTSELQSLAYLVCRLLLEKKKQKKNK